MSNEEEKQLMLLHWMEQQTHMLARIAEILEKMRLDA